MFTTFFFCFLLSKCTEFLPRFRFFFRPWAGKKISGIFPFHWWKGTIHYFIPNSFTIFEGFFHPLGKKYHRDFSFPMKERNNSFYSVIKRSLSPLSTFVSISAVVCRLSKRLKICSSMIPEKPLNHHHPSFAALNEFNALNYAMLGWLFWSTLTTMNSSRNLLPLPPPRPCKT